jgi:hypothetical protein
MLQHHEFDDPGRTSYGGYEGNQISAHTTSAEISSEYLRASASRDKIAPDAGGAVQSSSVQRGHQSLSRFAIAAMSLGTLLALIVICLWLIGGVSGWISFLIGSCVVLGVAITTTNGSK